MNTKPDEDGSYERIWAAFRQNPVFVDHWDHACHPEWSRQNAQYSWFIRFDDEAVVTAVAELQSSIQSPLLDLVAPGEIHQTLLSIASRDETADEMLDRIIEAARPVADSMQSMRLTLGPVNATREGVFLEAQSASEIGRLRQALYRSTLDVVGDKLIARPDFFPHISVAYANADALANRPLTAVELLRSRGPVCTTDVQAIELVELSRQGRNYRARTVVRMPLGHHSAQSQPTG